MSNYHSDKAGKKPSHNDKTLAAALAVWKAEEAGLTATELSKQWQEPEHRSCGSALSRAKKKYPYIVYEKQVGETHGRYYHIKYAGEAYLQRELTKVKAQIARILAEEEE